MVNTPYSKPFDPRPAVHQESSAVSKLRSWRPGNHKGEVKSLRCKQVGLQNPVETDLPNLSSSWTAWKVICQHRVQPPNFESFPIRQGSSSEKLVRDDRGTWMSQQASFKKWYIGVII